MRHDLLHPGGRSGPLHAERLGDPSAPAIVFLHGITGSRRYFRGRVAPLASSYRLILPDLPGFGLSPKPHVDYTPVFFRDSLRAFLEEERLVGRPLIFVGHSLGAIIAVEYAARWPEDAQRLVLISLPRYDSPEQAHLLFHAGSTNYRKLLGEQSMARNLAQLRRNGLDLFLRCALTFPFAVYADCRKFTLRSLTSTLLHSLIHYSVDGALARLGPLPVLLIHGARDAVAPVRNVRPLTEAYRQMRLEEIEGSGHHLFLTHTRRCLRLIEEFLGEESAAEPVAAWRERSLRAVSGGRGER